MLGWEVARTEDSDAAVRGGGFTALKHDERWQVSITGAHSVAYPSPGTGVAHEREARMEGVVALGVLVYLGRHGADDGEIIGARGDLREQVGKDEP